MDLQARLMTDFLAAYPAQPATAYWRGIEIAVLAEAGLPEGLGLDLGCGDGILTEILLRYSGERRLIGLDIDPDETTAARRYPFYERVHTCTAHAIPEPDASVDFVISNSVLEHIPDLEGVIAEVGRVLKPGGEFFFTVPCPRFRENLAGSLFGRSVREDYLRDLDKRLVHLNYLSAEDWAALCGRHGLAVERCDGYFDAGETRRWETLSRMTGGLLHALTGGRSRPIEIQRSLGLRALQNRAQLPRPLAGALAGLVSAGVAPEAGAGPSCLLVRGRRTRGA
jgi:SAM-dependent methyltransferase